MKKITICIFIIFILTGCSNYLKRIDMERRFYSNIKGLQVEEVRRLLEEEGADPNYCRGEFGWVDNNPLFNIHTYLTYRLNENNIQYPYPDVEILHLLVNAGADINARPYIWIDVYASNNDNLMMIKEHLINSGEINLNEKYEQYAKKYIKDKNKILKAFLEAGADPDKLGHPYPFSAEAFFSRINESRANKYFANGTRAINEAIKKGIVWESQVDLLLQYTILDEDSLLAAEESGDPAMIEKINRLWAIQQARR